MKIHWRKTTPACSCGCVTEQHETRIGPFMILIHNKTSLPGVWFMRCASHKTRLATPLVGRTLLSAQSEAQLILLEVLKRQNAASSHSR